MSKASAGSRFDYSDTQIENATRRRALPFYTKEELEVREALIYHGAHLTMGLRTRNRKPRKKSDKIILRTQALFEICRALPPALQKHWYGKDTVQMIRERLIAKLKLADTDDTLPEDVIISDLKKIRVLLDMVEKGDIPPLK
jgi:hypothetical protein